MTSAATQRVSIAPDGSAYPIPGTAVQEEQFTAIAAAAEAHRRLGGTVVVVQGLGFVGAAVCAAVAAVERAPGEPVHFVIGVDLGNEEGFWKIAKLEEGNAPLASPDPEFGAAVVAAVARGNLRATAAEAAYGLADTIVIDVDLGTVGAPRGVGEIEVDIGALERAVRTVGRHMRPEALVVVETTVPVGTCRKVVLPALAAERATRGIDAPVRLANAYERVMPGPRYLDSVRAYPRSFAGADDESARLARAFLGTFLDPERAPLQRVARSRVGRARQAARELVSRRQHRVHPRVDETRGEHRRGSLDRGRLDQGADRDARQHPLPRPRRRRVLPHEGLTPGAMGRAGATRQ